jgi:hypothetical protein
MVREPGLDIDTLFARIRLRTNEATNGAQTPWEVSQLQQVVMLVPGTPRAAAGRRKVLSRRRRPRSARRSSAAGAAAPIRDIGPEEAYAYAVEQDDLPTYVEYVRVYPDSPYSQRVWATIRARREALLWRRALLENSPEPTGPISQRYPDGMYVFDARRSCAGSPPATSAARLAHADYDDVPLPLAGEPARLIDVLSGGAAAAPLLGAPPAFIVNLPPPRRGSQGGLRRSPQPVFPVIINPRRPDPRAARTRRIGRRASRRPGGRPPPVPPGPPPAPPIRRVRW